ncbi:MAG: conserved membrane protein of unknown function [Promethearchaeota archaeon]|nr:MAG: conserved membrane protein of unknown function [Candidatus Lokiarchaeota archaeon]
MEGKKQQTKKTNKGLAEEICIWKEKSNCKDCNLDQELFCSPRPKYAILFATPLLVVIFGIVIEVLFFSKFNWIIITVFLGSWAAYGFFFLNVWESQILCNHCPYYANDEQKVLHCPIDRGKLKTGKYNPGPTTVLEKIQFIIGALILVGFPVPFLIIGELWISFILLIIGVSLWLLILQSKVCTDCINFACPLNRVPKTIRDDFFRKNPVIKKAWEEKGYQLD